MNISCFCWIFTNLCYKFAIYKLFSFCGSFVKPSDGMTKSNIIHVFKFFAILPNYIRCLLWFSQFFISESLIIIIVFHTKIYSKVFVEVTYINKPFINISTCLLDVVVETVRKREGFLNLFYYWLLLFRAWAFGWIYIVPAIQVMQRDWSNDYKHLVHF